jgi:hypothetical protein
MNIVGLMLAQVVASAVVQQLAAKSPGLCGILMITAIWKATLRGHADDLGADLDQLLLQARQRPAFGVACVLRKAADRSAVTVAPAAAQSASRIPTLS